jgi:type I restriction enzyme M protein
MDASQYKDYILVLLFMKYVSDKYGGQKDSPVRVPEGGSFQDMVLLKGKPGIGEGINVIIKKFAEENRLKGIIDVADFDDPEKLGKGKDMQDRLTNLISIFQNDALDFSKNKVEGDDILGDAYEYLMRNFATESGKSKAQFYTPAEVSRIIAQVIGINKAERRDQTLYDPTCGSGSLLLKAAHEAPEGITIYGQEKDVATRALAVMNMWLHENPIAVIERENTISNPQFRNANGGLKTFDFVVANPPFSLKSWSSGIDPVHDQFGRFEDGIPPKKNGDYVFLLHIIKSLKPNGKGAIILPHGVLFRGGAEAEIRESIVKRGYIKGIIGLPPNLFYGTGIPACIIVLDKENAGTRKGIFIVDASKGYFKDGNKNRLRERDIHQIVDVFNRQIEIPRYSRMVSLSEISDEKNNYNLNVPRYIDSQEDEVSEDIEAHLEGDIPNRDINELNSFWKICPSVRRELFAGSTRQGYSALKVDEDQITSVLSQNAEFKSFSEKIGHVYFDWRNRNLPLLRELDVGSKPKTLITGLSESILGTFSNLDLIDKYDVYQLLMTYWLETMQDDAYLIASNGWKAEVSVLKDKKEKITGWDCDLLPKQYVTNKYFQSQRDVIEGLQVQLDRTNQELADLEEESGGDDDIFSETRNDDGKVTKAGIARRLEEVKDDAEFAEEFRALTQYQTLIEKKSLLSQRIREEQKKLDNNLLTKYKHLGEDEVKELMIEDKWLSSIRLLLNGELNEVSRRLTGRLVELARRYRTPLPDLLNDARVRSEKVEGHLERMGFKWK